MSKEQDDINIEEGTPCNQDGCSGSFKPSPVVGCSCHINPPCSACVNAGYTCDSCGYETAPQEAYEYHLPEKKVVPDRSDEYTHTITANDFNSTPFTACCGSAAIDTDRCPTCNAKIDYHDDGLAERRRWANGGCLMCGKPRPKKKLGEAGTCYC